MSDKITIDELKVYLGTYLGIEPQFEYDPGCKIIGIEESSIADRVRVKYTALTDCGGLTGLFHGHEGSKTVVLRGAEIGDIKPIIRTWSHLTKEIEHNGERFVPILKLLNLNTTTRGDDLCKFAAKKTVERINNKSISYNELSKLSYWHFDVFNWLSRTGEDGQPLAIEMGI